MTTNGNAPSTLGKIYVPTITPPQTQTENPIGQVAINVGGVASYLGQVATRCGPAFQSLGSGSAIWGSGRSMHWARDKIVSPVVVWPMWSLSTANVQTLVAGGTVKCAIELTLGTRAAQNVEGAVSFVNGYAVCNFPGLVIPKGSQFWVDHLVQNANGIVFFASSQNNGQDATEGWTFGTGAVTDYTVSGTPPQSFLLTQGYRPMMILAQTQLPSIFVTGTSRPYGIADHVSDPTADLGYARLFGRQFGYTNMAVGSSTLAAYNSATKTYSDQILQGTIAGIATGVPYHSHFWGYDIINDLTGGGDSAATAVGRMVTQAASVPKHVFICATSTPNPASTDNFITLANQTPNVKVNAANDLIRSGAVTGAKLIVDMSDIVDPFRTGQWPPTRNPNTASIASASFTGVIASGTLTVSGITGTILPGVNLQGAGMGAATQILPYGTNGTTGTGGNGTYAISINQTIASEAMTTGSLITWEGLHESVIQLELIRDRGEAVLTAITR